MNISSADPDLKDLKLNFAPMLLLNEGDETLVELQAQIKPTGTPFNTLNVSKVRCNYPSGYPVGDTIFSSADAHTTSTQITSATITLNSDQPI